MLLKSGSVEWSEGKDDDVTGCSSEQAASEASKQSNEEVEVYSD